ncbi:MAG: 30S ribosome-binding factor RbfA [Clostridia bacterium]|nr:30S ribosome-binding factor RbfA [Clostridia bacterium]
MAGHRVGRTTEDIKREITAIIRELKDPRISGKMLTVLRVDVSNDLSFVKVYVSALEGIDEAKVAVEGLKSATGRIRGELGRRLHLRKSPEIKFIADDSVEHGMKIFKMLDDIRGGDDDEGNS